MTVPNLHFHGQLAPAQVAAWQQSMDVLLAPYQRSVPTVEWMSPLKIFEYMASGVPMIASDLPVLREVLVPDQTAILVEPHDVAQWEAALTSLRNPVLRRRFSQTAFGTVSQRFTWRHRARAVLPKTESDRLQRAD